MNIKPNVEILKEPKGFIKGIELVSLRQDCALWRLIDNTLYSLVLVANCYTEIAVILALSTFIFELSAVKVHGCPMFSQYGTIRG